MSQATIYHNPRCSKSRATLALLESNSIDTQIIKYLETPPSVEELGAVCALLGCSPRDLVRTGETDYKQASMDDMSLSDVELLSLMTQHPKVIQRPIVVYKDQAVIGRPPENVLALIA